MLFDPYVSRLMTRSTHSAVGKICCVSIFNTKKPKDKMINSLFVTAGIVRYPSCNLTEECANVDQHVTLLQLFMCILKHSRIVLGMWLAPTNWTLHLMLSPIHF